MPDNPLNFDGRSYQGQDQFVLDVLGGLRGGFFLDSGASNGVKGSNTWLLEKSFGWTGICVEPNDESFRHLIHHRACVCLNCCLYERDGPVEFLEAAGVYGGILQEYDPTHLGFTRRVLGDRWPNGGLIPSVQKSAHTIRSVLRRHRASRIIDYWSLDTEGSELSLLQSFPFDEYRFRVLTVEHNNGRVRENIRSLLDARGYTRVRDLGIDDGYVSNDELTSRAWQSVVWRGVGTTRR